MTDPATTLEGAFARLRAAAEADRETCALLPAALDAMMLALLVRLFAGLERMARAWSAARPRPLPRSRSQARIASGLVPPRAERAGPLWDWLVGLHRNRGMRPCATPPAPRRVRRTPPPEPAPTRSPLARSLPA